MYVVVGALGRTGRSVADALLSQSKQVRVVVRSPQHAESFRKRGAEVAVAQLDDVAALTAALEGATGSYLLLPPQMQSSDLRSDNARRTQGFVSAIKAARPKHVVFLSSIGAELDHGTGPITSLHDAERALRGAAPNVTIVRACYFMENWRSSLYALSQGVLPTFLNPDQPLAMVASIDVGRAAANALVEGGKGDAVIELSGPRDYTPRDVAEALSNLTGSSIRLEVAPEASMSGALMGAGLNRHWAELYQEMTHALNVGLIGWQREGTARVRGGTTIDQTLAQLLKQNAGAH